MTTDGDLPADTVAARRDDPPDSPAGGSSAPTDAFWAADEFRATTAWTSERLALLVWRRLAGRPEQRAFEDVLSAVLPSLIALVHDAVVVVKDANESDETTTVGEAALRRYFATAAEVAAIMAHIEEATPGLPAPDNPQRWAATGAWDELALRVLRTILVVEDDWRHRRGRQGAKRFREMLALVAPALIGVHAAARRLAGARRRAGTLYTLSTAEFAVLRDALRAVAEAGERLGDEYEQHQRRRAA